ncbi:uncharacterized protein E0L32_000643 [Thyridium curvatum]|uniref:Sterol-4-alpha-carboxylate 3-dehydrogenase ERG26, decarboxylating n=1 Tax=Thyridium curvatum TaxID=1093900 RepID=A0A507BA44_9PEZI|nr:uncharacterized protein E0L32_000643 [Thyridium curvatum]TPX14249.1 hypothetical protein E0L32_000643 [Thyridium curvatum]
MAGAKKTTAPSATAAGKKKNLGHVLVIGGCGFLGHHVVNVLLRDYACAAVSVVDLVCTRYRRPDSDGVRYYDADITDLVSLVSVFDEARPDVVIHTASPLAQGETKTAHALFKKVNVDGTAAVIEACCKTGVKVLVYTSSASVVSDNYNDLINADERWPVIRGKEQTQYYSETKAEAEEMVLKANEPGKLLTCAIRPSGIFGEGDRQAIVGILKVYLERKHRWQVGANDNLCDYTYVENVVHGHLLAVHALLATWALPEPLSADERVDGEVFIITNDSPIYFWDFNRAIWRAAGWDGADMGSVWHLGRDVGLLLGSLAEWGAWLARKNPTFTYQRCVFACMTRYFDITKAKKRLGYVPQVSLEEGVRRGVAWAMEQHRQEAAKA